MRDSLLDIGLRRGEPPPPLQPSLERLEERLVMNGSWESLAATAGYGNLYDSATDGTWVVGAYQNGAVEVRSAATGEVAWTMQTGAGRAYKVTVEDGVAYVSAGVREGGCVIAWDCATGRELWRTATRDFTNDIGIRDGVVGADVDNRGTLQLDAASGAVLAGGDSAGYYGTVIARGRVAYVKAGAQVWLDEGGNRRMLFGTQGISAPLSVSPDGRLLAVGRGDGGIEVWEAGSWRQVAGTGAGSGIASLGWSATGGTLLAGTHGGEVVQWTVSGDALTEVRRDNLGQPVYAVGEMDGAVVGQGGQAGAAWKRVVLAEERAEDEEAVSDDSAQSVEVADIEAGIAALSAAVSDAVFVAMVEGEEVNEEERQVLDVAALTASLQVSIRTQGMELPPLQRRVKEIDRELVERQSALAAAQTALSGAQEYVARIQKELGDVNTALNDARRRGDGIATQRLDSDRMNLEKILTNAVARRDAAADTCNDCATACDALADERADLIVAIAEREDALRSDSATWMMLKMLDGMTGDDAESGARALLDAALREGHEAMPHVKALVSILDTNHASSYDGGAQWIGTVTEVREHRSPVLTRAGGALRIIGRVQNNGNRAGWITVEGTGVSDLVTDPGVQQRLTVFLSPGESRDFAMTISVPGGSERAGSISLRAMTPDEDMVRNDKLVQRPKGTMDAYRQGIDAVAHNARAILLSPGGTGSAQSRVENYLATKPDAAAVLIAEARSGKNILDAQTTLSLIAAGNSPVVTIAMQERQEAVARVFGNDSVPRNWFAMAGMLALQDDPSQVANNDLLKEVRLVAEAGVSDSRGIQAREADTDWPLTADEVHRELVRIYLQEEQLFAEVERRLLEAQTSIRNGNSTADAAYLVLDVFRNLGTLVAAGLSETSERVAREYAKLVASPVADIGLDAAGTAVRDSSYLGNLTANVLKLMQPSGWVDMWVRSQEGKSAEEAIRDALIELHTRRDARLMPLARTILLLEQSIGS